MKKTITINPTGIVRHIDDLGRIVIPKEVRQQLHIREGDPLEIFPTQDGIFITPYAEEFIDKHKQRCLVLSQEEFTEEVKNAFEPSVTIHSVEFDKNNLICPVSVSCEADAGEPSVHKVKQALLYDELSRHFHYGRVNIIAIHDNAVIITFTEE